MLEIEKKNRLCGIDIIKIIATVMVVFYHFGGLYMGDINRNIYLPNINKMIMNFCAMSVPLFFMVNGAMSIGKKMNTKKYIKKVTKTIFIYCFWKLISAKFNLFCGTYDLTFSDVHLWFLESLAFLTIISPIIGHLYYCKPKYLILMCIILFIFPFCYNYIVIVGCAFGIELKRTVFMRLYSILYYVLGKVIFDKKVNLRNCKIYNYTAICAGWVLVTLEVIFWSNYDKSIFDGVNASFPTIGAMLMAIGTFGLLFDVATLKSKLEKVVFFLSKNIMGAYLVHPVVISAINKIIGVPQPIYIIMILSVCVTVTLCAMTSVLKRVPVIKCVFEI